MEKTRLEAFSDGVLAVIITIMVLELKVPHGDGIPALLPLVPVFLSYVLSFIYVGIYWNNHHHMFTLTRHVHGNVLWANLHLLFWLSLFPFATAWMGENHFAAVPVAAYAFILFMAALAWRPFHSAIVRANPESVLAKTVRLNDWKSLLPLLMYASAMGLAFVSPWLSGLLIVGVAAMWFIPEKRIEAHMKEPV
jgi:uncharacterized membrane protein